MRAKEVKMIPATRNFLEKDRKVIKNVGAYCRVSTDTEEQQGSYNSQVNYYTEKIKSTPGWRFVKVYGDEGISGTNADNRPGFQEMMQDCENGKLDLIITKSISRFSRNVTVTLEVARKLRDKDIGIFFEKENLNTLHYTSESLLAIFSSLAQAESESMSENIKMGREFKYKNGECCYNMGKVFGFNQDSDGIVTINEEQAVVVKHMYEGYLNGMSIGGIIKDLQERKISSPTGKEKWSPGTVERILSSEKYKGDFLTRKTFTVDPISKKKKKNTGQVSQYLITNHHPAIIEPEMFDMVQSEMARRGCIKKNDKKKHYGKYSGKFPFNNLIICGDCGAKYRRTMWVEKNGDKKHVWRCVNRIQDGKKAHCRHSVSINDIYLTKKTVEAINIIYKSRSRVKDILKCSIASLMGDTEQPMITENMARLEELSDLMRDAIFKNATGEMTPNQLEKICYEVKTESEKLRKENEEHEMTRKMKSAESSKLKQIFKAVDEMAEELTEIDNTLVRNIIEKMEVISEDKLTIWFIGDIAYEVELPELKVQEKY
ncbi:MAG: recombinase family protein [Clostridia bacterium]|nr:recombinase family protein [Clostridia bacterium]